VKAALVAGFSAFDAICSTQEPAGVSELRGPPVRLPRRSLDRVSPNATRT